MDTIISTILNLNETLSNFDYKAKLEGLIEHEYNRVNLVEPILFSVLLFLSLIVITRCLIKQFIFFVVTVGLSFMLSQHGSRLMEFVKSEKN